MRIVNRLPNQHVTSAIIGLAIIGLCHFATGALGAVPVPDGLISWWKGESNVVDSAGSANGYTTNGATFVQGMVGEGFSFDGITNSVVVPNTPSLNFGTNQNFSVETWIQAQQTPGNIYGVAIIATKANTPDSTQSVGWSLFLENGSLGFQLAPAPMSPDNTAHWRASATSLQDGKFHHVAVTVERTSPTGGKLFVDGKIVYTFNPTARSGNISTDGPLYIGRHDQADFNCFFKGIIDEVSIYNRSLTTNEISMIYQSGSEGKSTAPVAPTIIAQPISQEVVPGNGVTIAVEAVGTQPLSFQWSFNGTNISDATSNSLTLTNFQSLDAGPYAVVVTNAIGSATSSNAFLTVKNPLAAPAGLVGWWKGESNVVDSAGNANGYATNGAGYGSGLVGLGFSLDGTNNRVVVPDASALNFGTNQNFSIEAWIQALPTPGNYLGYTVIADKAYPRDASSVVGWMFYLSYGKLGFLMSQAPMTSGGASYWESSTASLQDGLFHHVAVTINRTSVSGGKLYVDGVMVRNFNPTTEKGDLSNTAPLRIGNHNNPDFKCNFKGIIDELSVYNRELTSNNIAAIYKAGGVGKVMVPTAPEIVKQPQSQQVAPGYDVTLDVGVIGTQPVFYQWTYNGFNLSQETNSTLTISHFRQMYAGVYTVVVSNLLGSVTSSNAVLLVKTPIQAPQGLVGWWKGESNVLDSVNLICGYTTNGADYLTGEVETGFSLDGEKAQVIIPNASVVNFGSNQNFSIETWIQAQTNSANTSGKANIAAKVTTTNSNHTIGWVLYLQSGQLSFQMSQASLGVSSVWQWSSGNPNLVDGKFHHVAATVNRSLYNGGKLYVDGVLVRTFDPTPVNGDLSTDGPLFIGCADNPASNAYFKGIIDEVSVYNRELSSSELNAIYQAAQVGKATQEFVPVITKQPADQNVLKGNDATLSIGIAGTPPLSFQWLLNGTNILGATSNTLVLSNVQPADSGSYSVSVSNIVGTVTSSNAAVVIVAPPQPPQGLIGWWRGESNVLDAVSFTSGYTTNGAGYGNGEVGTGFSLDGLDDAVIISSSKSLNIGPNQNFSVETWIQAQPTYGNYYGITEIVSKAYTPDPSQSVGWSLFLNQGSIGFLMSQSPMSPGNSSIWNSYGQNLQDGQFHHVAATIDRTSSSGGKIYVDGKLALTFDTTQESGDLSTDSPLFLGCHDNSTLNCNLKGIIDEVSIYNRVLTPAEITSIYQAADLGKAVQPFAPIITAQPANRVATQGRNAYIEVGVAGTPTLTYQWTFNGTNIVGATNNPLALTNVQLTDAGTYAVVISNSVGSVTSSNAVLTVILPVQTPSGFVGWWRGESNVVDEFSGSIGYLTNGAGFGPGEVGTGFSFDGTNNQVVIPSSPPLNFGSNQNFSVEAWVKALQFAQPPYGYYSQAITIADKSYNPVSMNQTVGWKLFTDKGSLLFTLGQASSSNSYSMTWMTTNAVINDENFHHVAATVDRNSKTGGKLYVDGKVVLVFDPTSQNGDLSNNAPLLFGTKTDGFQAPGSPLLAQNYFKGIIDEVTVYNRELTSNEIVAVYQAADAGKVMQASVPVIATQPVSQRIVRGQSVTMEVGAGGTQPLAFQWLFNGNELAGQTNASLVLTNVQFAQAGSYAVKVSNALGFVTSGDAILKVDFPPATVYVADASGSASLPITVPVVLEANGNENAVSFSVNFDPALLTFANVVNGSGAVGGSLFSNTNMVGSGKLGLILALPSGSVFSAGSQEVVKVMFNAARTLPGSTTVSLGNQPTLSQLSDVLAESLAVNFESGLVSILAADFEGDISPRPTGDKYVTLTDWVLEGRFVARLDDPATESEFQRADCAPQSTRGDGAITVFDWVQVGRYAVGMDAPVPAGGPLSEVEPLGTLAKDSSIITTDGSGCEVKIVELNLVQGRSGTVSVVLDAQGTENALAFSLAFDPTAIGFVSASLGSGAAGAMLNVNTNQAGAGHVGFAMALSPGQTFGTGIKEILKLNVQVAASATPGPSSFTFTDVPVIRGVSDAGVNKVPATFTHGVVDVNSSIPTLHISRLDDQVVLSWPDWGTNFLLQITGNSSTNLIWTNSVATTTVANGECAVKLPASAQTELYRLIQSGTQGGDIVTKQLEKPSVSAAPNK